MEKAAKSRFAMGYFQGIAADEKMGMPGNIKSPVNRHTRTVQYQAVVRSSDLSDKVEEMARGLIAGQI